MFENIKVYAFVGPSGTGKSYRAQMVAGEKDVHFIIDDGLLINENRVVAGESAKKASTKIETVKKALFLHDDEKKVIQKALKKYKVKTIELGVQSANDYILKKAGRGHTFEDVVKASKLIRWYGFELGHQMMVGLPESTTVDEINTAKQLIKLKPKMVRIYPVLVIKNTKLEKDYNEGKYKPLTVIQAVEVCKELDPDLFEIKIGFSFDMQRISLFLGMNPKSTYLHSGVFLFDVRVSN